MPDAWTLEYGSTVLEIGDGDNGIALAAAPSVEAAEVAVDDQPRPRADGTVFGRDYLVGTVVRLPISCVGATEAEAVEARNRLQKAWRAEEIRDTPGAVAMLRSGSGRVAFGRPRRISVNDEHTRFGLAIVTADFVTADANWYGAPAARQVSLLAAPTSGLVAPLVAPLTAVGERVGAQVAVVEGDLPADLVVTFRGPFTNPRAEIGPVVVELRGSIPFDQAVTVDAAARSITRSGGGASGSAAGMLTARSTLLTKMQLPPGQHEIVLRGSSTAETAGLEVAWRPKFTSY